MRGRPPELDDASKLRLRRMREQGLTIESCMEVFEISRPTVMRALRELRKTMGWEKLPDGHRARWRGIRFEQGNKHV